jgi:putative acetyltransferase
LPLPPGILLRAYTDTDRESIIAIRRLAFAELAASHYSREELAAGRARMEDPAYAEDLRQCNLMLAVDRDDAVLGGAGWSAQKGEPAAARIRKVFVHPASARRGLGTALVVDAERRASAAGHERFVVRASLNAVPFYQRLGYHVVEATSVPRAGDVSLRVVLMRKPWLTSEKGDPS